MMGVRIVTMWIVAMRIVTMWIVAMRIVTVHGIVTVRWIVVVPTY
jgi:hypothetical protein